MIEFIEGGFYSGAHEHVKKAIADRVSQKKRTVLIVPEQQTVMAESEMARELTPDAPLYFEVSNFTRFANTAFRALGGIRDDYATPAKKALIMWQTLTELSVLLKMTRARREISASLVERAIGAVKEAETLGLDLKDLSKVKSEGAVTERLRDKLSDLASIYSLYKSKLLEKYSDTADDIELLIKKLSENPNYLTDTHIFIEGFTSFTASQYALIGVLCARTDMTVMFNIPKVGGDAFEYTEPRESRSRIAAIADKAGVEKKIRRLDGRVGVRSDVLAQVCPVLWKSNYVIDNLSLQNLDDLRIFEARTPFDECELVASDIKRRVMDGASYRDFAIVMASSDKYDGILDTGLDKAGIPYFSSFKSSITDFEAVKLIFSALAAVGGFAASDILAYASCGLCGISPDERDELETYVTRWKITGERFTDGVTWNMHPDGFDGKPSKESEELLLRLDATRVKLIQPLMALEEATGGKKTTRELAEALFVFLDSIELEESLYKRASELWELGFYDAAEENSRLYGIITASLDTLVEVLGDTLSDRVTFANQLKVVFSSEAIGRIPASLDEVTVGSADMLRLCDKRHIYLIGANYGQFPAAPKSASYFTDKDKEALSSLGALMDSSEDIKGARALYTFSRAFAYASDTVTITYSRTDSAFSALIPSFVISNIERLTGGLIKPKDAEALTARERLYSSEIAAETLGKCTLDEQLAVRLALDESGRALPFSDTATIENGALSYSGLEADSLYLTQSRIDTFVSCPLQYFCKYTLSLDEGERAEFGASGIGSYVHAILENFFREVKEKSIKVSDISKETRIEMAGRAAKKYLMGLENELGHSPARMKTALSRILRASFPIVDGLCEEFSESGFSPAFFELKISGASDDGPAPVEIHGQGGEKIFVYGTIDRVDTMKSGDNVFVRVVDYKTGSKEFQPDDIDDGKNLQMFLYLKSITDCKKKSFRKLLGVGEGGEILPAGLIYVKTEIKDQRVASPSDEAADAAVKAAQRRVGMILDDNEVIGATGEKYLPVKFTKSGEVDKRYAKYLYTPEDWNEISDRIDGVVGRIGHMISSGYIKSTSGKDKQKKSPCEWCKFKAFCRNIKL